MLLIWLDKHHRRAGAKELLLRRGRGILILDHHGLGNVIMSLPLLRAICRWTSGRWPVRILLKSPDHFDLLREEGISLIPLYYHLRYRGLRGMVRLWRDLRGATDLIIGVPQVTAKNLIILKFALGARYTAGEAYPPYPYPKWLSFPASYGYTKSILKTQEEIAAALGIEVPLGFPSIRLAHEELEWAKSVLLASGLARRRPLIGLHCSATTPDKRWPPELFGLVLLRLKNQFPDLSVISFGTKVELPNSEEAHRAAGDIRWLEGNGLWTIRQSLALLRQCDLVVSGDTGIMHMAAAVGSRTLSIFGSTSIDRLAPTYNGGVAISPGTSCHPCLRFQEPIWCKCIRLISPDRVAEIAERCLRTYQTPVVAVP
jgi:ADP-heptose:LPS heptosyltransferase